MRILSSNIVVQFCNLCNGWPGNFAQNKGKYIFFIFFAEKFAKGNLFIVSLSSKSEKDMIWCLG